MGYRGNYQCKLDWVLIARLYAASDGTKAIAKAIGANQASIREGLIKRGLYQFGQNRKSNGVGVWAGYYDAEIAPLITQERHHQAWWRKAHPSQKNHALEAYYANHEQNKAKCAQRSKARYYRIKHTPEYKAKQFARAQLRRIKRQAMGYAKTCRTHEYLGCTYQQAADYITAQLPPQWTWSNYGTAWEIDHRIQLSDGLLTDQEHIKRVCHHANLRPLAVRENRTRAWGSYAGKHTVKCLTII